ncbi:hypothetical protein [Leisingera caerulea]|uniref:hypothetical protein n=1 Tax=Leisingera caerulea TaxID=506591 RepID=UPI000487C742|nr:hypothetical protein [Leisingera caerulea]
MTQHTPQTEHGKAGACQIVHLSKEVRFDAPPKRSLHVPANGAAENTRRQAERVAGLSARIHRHIAAKGYPTRPPALIAPGALR